GAGIGEALVAAWHHARQREGGAAEQAGDAGRFLHVGGGIAAHAFRVGAEHLVDLRTPDALAGGPGQAEGARRPLPAVAGQLAGREVVPAHGVERVDQLATRDRVARPAHRIVAVTVELGAARGRALPQAGRTGAAERERNPERARAAGEERQIEAVQ